MSYSTAAQAGHRNTPRRSSQPKAGSTHIEDTSNLVDGRWWHREYMEHVIPRPGPGCLPPKAATLIHAAFHQLYKVTVTPPTFSSIDAQPGAKLQPSLTIGQSGSALGPSTSSAGLARHRPPSESEVRYLVPHPYVQFCRRDMIWVYHQVKSSMYLPQMIPNSGTLPSEAARKSSQSCVDDGSGVRDMGFSSSKAKTHHFHHYPKSVKGSSLNPPFVRRKFDIETAAADTRRRLSKASSSRHRAKASSAPSSDSNEILLDLWVCCQFQTYVISSGPEAVSPSILDWVLLQRYMRDRENEPTSRPSKEESVVYSLETILRMIENFVFKLDNRMVKVGANLIKKIGWTPAAQEFLAFLGFQHTPVTATETESHPEGRLQAPRLSEGPPENDIKRARLLQSWLELSIITQHYRRRNERALQAYELAHKLWVSIENTMKQDAKIGAHETQIKQMPLTQSQLIDEQARVFWGGLGTTPETHSAEVIKFAYRLQTQCDPQNTPTFLYFLRGITDWAMRMRHSSAEGLQMLIGQEDSRGRWATDDLSRAATLLGFLQEDFSAIGDVQLPPNYREDLRDTWLTRVKEANAELAENRINRQMADDRKRELKGSFRILAEHSGAPELVQAFKDTMSIYGNGMVDVQEAYNTLKITKEMDEDMVVTVFNMRVEDRPNLRERMLSALLVIGEDRNSSRLKNLALTGTDEGLPPPGSSSQDWPRHLQELDYTCQLDSRPNTSSVPPFVSSSTMADTSSSAHSEPNENTALLPPGSGSQRGRSEFTSFKATAHPPLSPALSTSQRSTHLTFPLPLLPIPLRQTPHRTWPFRLALAALISLAFLSTAALVATVLNIWLPRLVAPYLPAHRGSRVLPFWFAAIATWLSLTTLNLFWIPSRATRISLRVSLALMFFDLIVLSTVPEFLHQESVLTTFTCFLALGVTAICLLSNNLVQEAKEEEVKIIGSTEINGREPDRRAEASFLAEEQNYWMKQSRTEFKITTSFLMASFANIILIVSRLKT
ncbi:ubiquitin-specific protease ubp2 [Tulasnella sp. 408]|nr:ubiquitin-specific protease ubp2 [Tulasnella sp. 408]